MSGRQRYGNVWVECGANSRMAERFYLPGYEGYLPFFLWGDELAAFERNEKIEFREEQLLKGILFGLYEFDVNPKLWDHKADRRALIYLLDTLGNGFGFETPEKMILDVAFGMRVRNWNGASRIVLEVGVELVPESSEIKSDLINDLWAIAAEFGQEESLFEEIMSLLKKINLDEISPDAREIICYYGLCSLIFLGRESDVPAYINDYIYPNVSMSKLKLNITALLKNPRGYSPAELRVT
jgi:hypothetical protein